MKFDAVTIKNFRNFENITIDLTNKNVLFGMNDVGKTNFLYRLFFIMVIVTLHLGNGRLLFRDLCLEQNWI